MIEWGILIGSNIILFFVMLIASRYYQSEIIIDIDGKLSKKEAKFLKSAFWDYLISAWIQQTIIIIGFSLIKDLIPLNIAIISAAFIFMLLHFPNMVLSFAVFGMELFLLILYTLAGPIIIPGMIFTHSLLATCLLFMFPEEVHYNFQVWFGFFKRYPNKH